jgi:hypothetical protein
MPQYEYPYRNRIGDKTFKYDPERKYHKPGVKEELEELSGNKPIGFWYQFRNCILDAALINEDSPGSKNLYLQDVKLKRGRLCYIGDSTKNTHNKVLSISTPKDYQKFRKKYSRDRKDFLYRYKTYVREKDSEGNYNIIQLEPSYQIDWAKVYSVYGGIEIKNYYSIKVDDFNHSYDEFVKGSNEDNLSNWIEVLDFSSGCIWNLDIIKEVSCVRKITIKEIETSSGLRNHKVCG